jgi:hypothetical protein
MTLLDALVQLAAELPDPGTLEWSVPLVYALTALMFAAIFGARSIERRERRER